MYHLCLFLHYERGREGREREREREREGEMQTLSIFHPGIWRIHWLSFLDVDVLASSLKEDQSTDE